MSTKNKIQKNWRDVSKMAEYKVQDFIPPQS